MNAVRDYVHKLIDQMSDAELADMIGYITYIKAKGDKGLFTNLSKASESSTSFWDNNIDDQVWNNV